MRLAIGVLFAFSALAQTGAKPKPSPPKPAAPKTAVTKPPAPAASWRQLRYPPSRPLQIPQVESYTLPNGMRVYLLEDHELPMVNGVALVRTGNLFDPPDKVGLASMTGIAMRSGGTKSLTGDAIDDQLDGISASLESSIGESNGTVRFSCLASTQDPVMQIFRDLLTAPQFRDDKISLVRTQLRGAISKRNDEPRNIASRELASIVYGRQSPYGWPMEHQHVHRIRRVDLVAFHERYFFPANAMLAIWGDFKSAEMKARIEGLFAGWNAKQNPVPAFPEVAAKPAPGVFLAAKPKVAQTFFEVGHLGGRYNDKDYAALEVMARVLGGGFSSRLFVKIRSQLGWAHSISANWDAQFDHPGLFRVSGSTKSTSAADTLEAIEEEVRKLQTTDISDSELRLAKDAVLNGFVFDFDTPEKAILRILTYDYFGYPKDFIFQYQRAVSAVTKADVRRVASSYLKPDQLTFVAVADTRDFLRPLTILNRKVEEIDLKIPELSAENVKPTPESIEAGKKLLKRMQESVGGLDKLSAIKDWSEEAVFKLTPSAGGLTATQIDRFLAPNHFRQTVTLPYARLDSYCDGENGWIVTPRGDGPLLGDQLKQAQNEIFRSYVWLFMSDRDPTRTVHMPEENVVEVLGKDGQVARITYDPATGMPSGAMQDMPLGNMVEQWFDFKPEGGVQFPRRIAVLRDGNPYASVTVNWVKVNQGETAEKISRRPAR